MSATSRTVSRVIQSHSATADRHISIRELHNISILRCVGLGPAAVRSEVSGIAERQGRAREADLVRDRASWQQSAKCGEYHGWDTDRAILQSQLAFHVLYIFLQQRLSLLPSFSQSIPFALLSASLRSSLTGCKSFCLVDGLALERRNEKSREKRHNRPIRTIQSAIRDALCISLPPLFFLRK